jgi:hypothetical protein
MHCNAVGKRTSRTCGARLPTRDHYPGPRTDRLLRDTDQPGRYIVYAERDDHEQFDAFVRAPGLLWLLDTTDHWIAPPHWRFFEDVEGAQQSRPER